MVMADDKIFGSRTSRINFDGFRSIGRVSLKHNLSSSRRSIVRKIEDLMSTVRTL
jgi:hypothetical protein